MCGGAMHPFNAQDDPIMFKKVGTVGGAMVQRRERWAASFQHRETTAKTAYSKTYGAMAVILFMSEPTRGAQVGHIRSAFSTHLRNPRS